MKKKFEFFFIAIILVLSFILTGYLSKKLSLKKKTNLSDNLQELNFLQMDNPSSRRINKIMLKSNLLKIKSRSHINNVKLDNFITNINGELKYLEFGKKSNFSKTCNSCNIYVTQYRNLRKDYILNCNCDNSNGESISSELNLQKILNIILK